MSLSNEQIKQLHEKYIKIISFYYKKVKEPVIAAELLHKDKKIFVPSVNELRNAFDHLARVHGVVYGIVPAEKIITGDMSVIEYCNKNLEKAHGHLYRAAYDAYDVIAIYKTRSLQLEYEKIPKQVLFAVIPDALNRVVIPINKVSELLVEAKLKKDVEDVKEEEEQFDLYEKAIKLILDVEELLRVNGNKLITYEKGYLLAEEVRINYRDVPKKAIYAVIPDAANIVVLPYEKASELMYKSEVEGGIDHDKAGEAIKLFQEVQSVLHKYIVPLNLYIDEDKEGKWKDKWGHLIRTFIVGLIMLALGFYLNNIYRNNKNASAENHRDKGLYDNTKVTSDNNVRK